MIIDFHKIAPIKSADEHFENAIRKAAKRVAILNPKGDALTKHKTREIERYTTIRDTLFKYFDKISKNFPNLDTLPEFYIQLLESSLDFDKLKQSLGSLKFAKNTLHKLTKDFSGRVRAQTQREEIPKITKQFFGRSSSVVKQINKNLEFLEKSRKILRNFPALDPEQFTMAIAGFPNVGKSTLLSKITTAKPEIKNYAFTTKGLNVGTFEYKFHKLQLVDTPGTLAREKENVIEQLATITRNFLAKATIYVFDITEPYPIEDQKRLYEFIKEEGLPVVLYLSKTDILSKDKIEVFKKEFPEILTDPNDVLKVIKEHFNQWL